MSGPTERALRKELDTLREADAPTGHVEGTVRAGVTQAVEVRGVGGLHGVAPVVVAETPAVEDDESCSHTRSDSRRAYLPFASGRTARRRRPAGAGGRSPTGRAPSRSAPMRLPR